MMIAALDWAAAKQAVTHTGALHQAGRRAEAETRFREAEQMQEGGHPPTRCSTRRKATSIATRSSPPPSAPRGES